MILYKRIYTVSFICSLILFASCGKGNKSANSLSEGVIEFNASVVDENHPMAGLAPGSATVKFKDNRFQVEMSTMGIFNTTFISDPGKKTLSQLVKFMDIKDACIQTEADLAKDNQDYALKLEETNETKKIAGYNCKKVKATLANDPSVTFDVYYTDELGSDSLNYLGPYRSIKGMLMEYRLKKLGLEMKFTATEVKKEEVKDDCFEIPSFYRIVTKPEMEKLFEDIQN